MSSFGAHPHGASPDEGAAWRSLSGDPLPAVPQLSTPQPQPQPDVVYGGWQQPWQDEFGQWHSPYVAHEPQQSPPYEGAEQLLAQPQPDPQQYAMPPEPQALVVPVEELAPVGPPRYLAPTRVARDPRQRAMASVIVFICLLVGLWAMLGFLGSLAATLTSINSGNQKLKAQMTEANAGLESLDTKTGHLAKMSEDSSKMKGMLGEIDTDMGTMLTGVNGIASGMSSMSTSLTGLEADLGKVNGINEGMAAKLGTINAGLANQVKSVTTMRRDVEATGVVLKSLEGRLKATNGRLAHVNNAVNTMGACGIQNNLKVSIFLGPLRNGSAEINATVIPPMAWGDKTPGVTPC